MHFACELVNSTQFGSAELVNSIGTCCLSLFSSLLGGFCSPFCGGCGDELQPGTPVRQSKVLLTKTGSVTLAVSYYEDGWGREESITASSLAVWLQGAVWFWSELPVTLASCTLVHFAEWVCCDCSFSSIEQPWRFYQRYKPAPGREIRLQTHDKSHIHAWQEFLVQNSTLNVIWIETSRPQVLEQQGNQHQLLQFTDLLLCTLLLVNEEADSET